MQAPLAQADFYLAASGLIPALALADVVLSRRTIAIGRSPEFVARLNRIAPWVEAAGALIWGAFFTWAEFICLRSLETGSPPFGGPVVVWVALAVLAVQTVAYWIQPKLAEALPARFPSDQPLRLWRT